MNRRDFITGCAGLSLAAKAGEAFGESGPLTRIVFPFSAGGGGDALCRVIAQYLMQALDRNVIVENKHRRRRPDRHQVRQECQPRRNDGPGDHRSDHVSAADGGGRAELRHREGFRAGVAAGALRIRGRRGAGGGRKGFQADSWPGSRPTRARRRFGVPSNGTIPHFTGSKLEQVLGIPMTRVAYRGSAPIINDLHRRPSAVRYYDDRGRDPSTSRRWPSRFWPSAVRSVRRSCRMCRP